MSISRQTKFVTGQRRRLSTYPSDAKPFRPDGALREDYVTGLTSHAA
jgi:hypothetical protein